MRSLFAGSVHKHKNKEKEKIKYTQRRQEMLNKMNEFKKHDEYTQCKSTEISASSPSIQSKQQPRTWHEAK